MQLTSSFASILALIVAIQSITAAPICYSGNCSSGLQARGKDDIVKGGIEVIELGVNRLSSSTSKFHDVFNFFKLGQGSEALAQKVAQVVKPAASSAAGVNLAKKLAIALPAAQRPLGGAGATALLAKEAKVAAKTVTSVIANTADDVASAVGKKVADKTSIPGVKTVTSTISKNVDDVASAAAKKVDDIVDKTSIPSAKVKTNPVANAAAADVKAAASGAFAGAGSPTSIASDLASNVGQGAFEKVIDTAGKKVSGKLVAGGMAVGVGGVVVGAEVEDELNDNDDDNGNEFAAAPSKNGAAVVSTAGAAAAVTTKPKTTDAVIEEQCKNIKEDPLTADDKDYLTAYIQARFDLGDITSNQRQMLLKAVNDAALLPIVGAAASTTVTPTTEVVSKVRIVQQDPISERLSRPFTDSSDVTNLESNIKSSKLSPAERATYQATLDTNPTISSAQRTRFRNAITAKPAVMSASQIDEIVWLIDSSTLECDNISWFLFQVQRQFSQGSVDKSGLARIMGAYERAADKCTV